MADDRREFQLSIINDASRFSTDQEARELVDLGKTAEDTSRDVDRALDRMADSSETTARRVNQNMDRAGDGMRDFKDEANSSGREAAASFTGSFDDVTGLVQEIGANAFSGFGRLAQGAALAGAAAFGILVAKVQETQQRMSELRQLFFDLDKEGAGSGLAERVEKIADELDPDKLRDIQDALRETGIEAGEFFAALAGDAGAQKRVEAQISALIPAFNLPWDTKATEAQHLGNVLDDYIETAADAATAAGLYRQLVTDSGDAAKDAAPKVDELTLGVKGLADAQLAADLDTVKASLEGVGGASSTLAADVAEDGKVTAAAILKTLREDTRAKRAYVTNLRQVMEEGGAEFAAWVAEQGPEVARGYIEGSQKQRDAIRKAFRANVGVAAGDGIAEGFAATRPDVGAEAGRVRRDVEDWFRDPITTRVRVQGPSPTELGPIARDIQRALSVTVNPFVANPRYAPGG